MFYNWLNLNATTVLYFTVLPTNAVLLNIFWAYKEWKKCLNLGVGSISEMHNAIVRVTLLISVLRAYSLALF